MTISGRTILFVEDDKQQIQELSAHFSNENAVVFVSDVEEAVKYLRFINFDALVLDIVLPNSLGLELLQTVPHLPPTVIYSSLDSEHDILHALSLGAVDYIVKPCSMRLLEAKLKLRLLPTQQACMSCNGLFLNPTNKKATYYGEPIPLTSSEINLLVFLMKHHNRFFSGDELYEKIWNAKSLNSATVRKHLSSLRQKLENSCNGKELIINEFGKGYAFIGDVKFE